MRLEDWYFTKYDGKTITMDTNDEVRLVGRVYDSPEYPDDAVIVTSTVAKFENGTAVTCSGHRYELGKKSDVQDAMKKGIPVIQLAKMIRRELMEDPPMDLQSPDFVEQILEAKVKIGIVLWGEDNEGNKVVGEVLRSNGHIFTLKVFNEFATEFNETDVYVCHVI
ncbi:hypothetical protein IKF92_00475 [Candidatus Saccharibacteria bacterium]|nr:hypothetical protein [Candidatus Saccharibacteria bacterium]